MYEKETDMKGTEVNELKILMEK